MKSLRIFVSSPGDVGAERSLAHRVVARLQNEFAGRARLEAVLWEHEPLVATSTFQTQIVRPSETDITICILWSRLGTRLPAEFVRPDGRRYASGTEFEFEDAVQGLRRSGRPELLVYRKTTDPVVSLSNPEELLRKLEQKKALDGFIEHWFYDHDDGTLRGAFHAFERPEEFESLLETHLRKLVERQLPPVERPLEAVRARWTQGSPFRGLQAFDVEHADVFFGRTAAVGEVVDALREQQGAGRPFVLIVGHSGGGKSSLARAGVLPMLTQRGVIEGVGSWRRTILRPGDGGGDLLHGLAGALLAHGALPELEDAAGGQEGLARLLRESPTTVAPLLRAALALAAARGGDPEPVCLALVVDQLEEIFTQADEEERGRFTEALAALVGTGRVWAVATLRADVYPRLAEIPRLLELKEGKGQYDLRAPTPAELGQIVRHPVAAAGLRLEEDALSGVRLEDVLRDSAARMPNSLPLLEFTLEELYRQRASDGTLTLAAYREIGGLEGSLARRAEDAFQACGPSARAAFTAVMRQLVVVADPEDAGTVGARRATSTQVAASPGATELVQALVDARLLVTDLGRDGEPVVGIAHEALLRHWPRLTAWLDDDRDLLKARARLAQSARRWAEERRALEYLLPVGKPLEEARDVERRGSGLSALEREFLAASTHRARRFARIRRAAFAGLAGLTVVSATLAWTAYDARERASEEALSATRTHEFTVGLLSDSGDPLFTGGEEWTVKRLLDFGTTQLLEQGALADVPRTRARALLEWSRPYDVREEFPAALRLARAAEDAEAALNGVPDSVRAETWLTVGEYLLKLDSLASAQAYLERAVTGLAGTAREPAALRQLGDLHLDQGRALDALPELEAALAAAPPADTLLSIGILGSLGRARYQLGDPEGAERAYRDALQRADRLAGGGRPDAYAMVAHRFSNLLWVSSRQAQADSILAETEHRQVAIFGERHGAVAVTVKLRGALARSRGDFTEADSLLRRALSIEQAAYGPGHSHPAITELELSQLLMQTGRYQEADSLAAHARAALAASLGARHPRVASAWVVSGHVQRAQGRYDAALAAYDSALACDLSEGADLSRDRVLIERGSLRAEVGDRTGAESDLTQALELVRALGDRGREAAALEELETALYHLDDYEAAEQWAEEGLRVKREVYAAGSPQIAAALGDVAFYRAARGDREGTLIALREGWSILDSIQAPDADAFQAHRALIGPLLVLDDVPTAIDRADRLRVLLEQAEPPRPAELADVLVREGRLVLASGDRPRARALARRGVELLTDQFGADHPETEAARQLLAEAR
ncbi:MAG: tetratricopeptide repeat protein [Gemmatimonadota bacterium]